MEVEAAIEAPIIFAGDQVKVSVKFSPSSTNSEYTPILLSGYAVMQGSFKLGDMMLSSPFAETRKEGIVLTKRGFNYGQTHTNTGLFSGVLGGIKNLVVSSLSDSSSKNPNISSGSNSGNCSSVNDREEDDEFPIFATSQLLLFTDLELTEPQKFQFTVTLPEDLPPTYRSRSLHISYNLVVGFERIQQNTGDSVPYDTRVFLPCRVLPKPLTIASPIPVKFDLLKPRNAGPPKFVEDVDISKLSDGGMDDFINHLVSGNLDSTHLEKTRDKRDSVSHSPGAQYSKVSYDINHKKVPIAQLVLGRPAIAVGDVLTAQVRFKRPCLHLSVYLELEELIEEPYAALGSSNGVGNNNASEENNKSTMNSEDSSGSQGKKHSNREVVTTYTVYARQFQSVYGVKEIPIYLPTLTSVTPRLDTQQLTAGWSLRIELVGLVGSAFFEDEDGLLAKGQVEHESFSCRIPVVVLPPASNNTGICKTWHF